MVSRSYMLYRRTYGNVKGSMYTAYKHVGVRLPRIVTLSKDIMEHNIA